MSYQIIRDRNGWIINEEGEVLIRDIENQADIWVQNNLISFDEHERPRLKVFNETSSQTSEETLSFYHIDRDNESVDETGENGLQSKITVNDCSLTPGTSENDSIWSENETRRLITLYAEHQDDIKHAEKKKFVWDIISERMVEKQFQKTAAKCQRKWINLCRVYRSIKDQKKSNQSGRGRKTPFIFYDALDEILGELPSNSQNYNVDVAALSSETELEIVNDETTESNHSTDITNDLITENQNVQPTNPAINKKRKNYTQEYFKSKINYHKMKEIEREQRNTRHKEKMELENKKLEIEQKKVNILQELLVYTKRNDKN
ncbi:unnamed protein product [Psylliodes chrysocephalus]|uniref:Myb-like domain-containing protein n=1 Tax=Psylliodes chrysocephalus TaxID=3402493 RepID=A0A9P0CNP3_9CUCU|nr:unnamed protein product [Psylliodes chrysocephala]